MKFLYFAIIAFVLLQPQQLFSQNIIEFALGEWAPYTSEKDPKGKLAEVIIQEAFKSEQVAVKYSYFPWKRSYHEVKVGKQDGTFPWFSSIERKLEFVINKEPLFKEKEVFFHLKSMKFDWKEFKDLLQYKIGGTSGYSHVGVLRKQGLKVETVSRDILNFKKLVIKRVDLVPASEIVGYYLINTQLNPQTARLITHHPRAIQKDDMFVLFSKNTKNGQDLADKLDRGLLKMKSSGRYDEIIQQYLKGK